MSGIVLWGQAAVGVNRTFWRVKGFCSYNVEWTVPVAVDYVGAGLPKVNGSDLFEVEEEWRPDC